MQRHLASRFFHILTYTFVDLIGVEISEHFVLWLPLKKRPQDRVFGDLKSYQVDKGIRKYMEETGLGVTLHGLRHGFASILYKNNVDIKTAAYVLGHAQSSTTLEIYTHLMEQDKLRSVRNALNAI